MFSLLMSSVPTPRKAPSPTKKESVRAVEPGSWSSIRAMGPDSCAYTMPPAIAASAATKPINKANFLRDILVLRKDFVRFHARGGGEFQLFRSERRHAYGALD